MSVFCVNYMYSQFVFSIVQSYCLQISAGCTHVSAKSRPCCRRVVAKSHLSRACQWGGPLLMFRPGRCPSPVARRFRRPSPSFVVIVAVIFRRPWSLVRRRGSSFVLVPRPSYGVVCRVAPRRRSRCPSSIVDRLSSIVRRLSL